MESLYKSRNLSGSVLVIAVAFILSACAGNPTGGANFVLMSESAELEKRA
ncbi:hypothetical protein N8600_02020 [Gammaproteobacteria bacterium]|nr:hypothetical protein [Gammaproteobacteria bacterium]